MVVLLRMWQSQSVGGDGVSLHENFGSGNTDANPDLKPNDMVMTPRHIAKQMIDFYHIHEYERVLDPCAGSNAFFDQYPSHILGKWRMEITEGLDFFGWNVSRSLTLTGLSPTHPTAFSLSSWRSALRWLTMWPY